TGVGRPPRPASHQPCAIIAAHQRSTTTWNPTEATAASTYRRTMLVSAEKKASKPRPSSRYPTPNSEALPSAAANRSRGGATSTGIGAIHSWLSAGGRLPANGKAEVGGLVISGGMRLGP